MWWEYLAVAGLLGAALYYLVRRMRRSLDPKAAPACGCGCASGCGDPGQDLAIIPDTENDKIQAPCSQCHCQDRRQTSHCG